MFEIMQDLASNPVSKFKLKMNKDGKDYEEQVDVDTQKETETFHVPKTSPDDEAGDIVYDFKKNLTMIRLPATNSCFLSDSTDDVPKPATLVKLLGGIGQVEMPRQQIEVKFKVVGTLEDRSGLSDEMADLCEKLPIYIVVEGEVDSTQAALQPTKTAPGKRSKRHLVRRWVCSLVCRPVCPRVCNGWFCYTACSVSCSYDCHWVWVPIVTG